jgi:hypothetical protein
MQLERWDDLPSDREISISDLKQLTVAQTHRAARESNFKHDHYSADSIGNCDKHIPYRIRAGSERQPGGCDMAVS